MRLRVVVIGATALAITGYAIFFLRPSTRVRRAISRSKQCCRLGHFDAAREAASAALRLASAAIPTSPAHMDAVLQIAVVLFELHRFRKALVYLDELIAMVASIHGEACLEMLPALHAKVEVLEADEQLSKAAEELARAREIQRVMRSEPSIEAAAASSALAKALLRAAHQDNVAIRAAERAAHVNRCVVAGLEAIAMASAVGSPQRAVEIAAELLEMLAGDGTPAGVAARGQLSAAYREHANVEWTGCEGVVEGHGLDDVLFPATSEGAEEALAPGTPSWSAIPDKVQGVVRSRTSLLWGGEVEGTSLVALSEVMTAIVHEVLAAPEPAPLSAECLTWVSKVPATLRFDTFVKAALLSQSLRPAALERVRVLPSSIPNAGDGVFAHGRIARNELATMYPCHAILLRADGNPPREDDEPPDGNKQPGSDNKAGGKAGADAGHVFLWTVPAQGAAFLQPVCREARGRLVSYLAQVDGSPISIAADPLREHTPAACGHLINDAASLCADPTAADEDAYVAASVAGCNCIFLPICGCALAVVAIRDIEDGHELFASYGICSWVDDHGAEARAHAWGQFLGM